MRSIYLLRSMFLMSTLVASACGGGSTPMSPVSPMNGNAGSMAGTWTGTAADSSGSMMGGGQTAAMMSGATWTLTQSGSTFSGTMQFPGYMGGEMNVSGAMNGTSGTFTITMMGAPGTSMMQTRCGATASGTFDMDDTMTRFHGTYQGSNTCSGPFDRGTISMQR